MKKVAMFKSLKHLIQFNRVGLTMSFRNQLFIITLICILHYYYLITKIVCNIIRGRIRFRYDDIQISHWWNQRFNISRLSYNLWSIVILLNKGSRLYKYTMYIGMYVVLVVSIVYRSTRGSQRSNNQLWEEKEVERLCKGLF